MKRKLYVRVLLKSSAERFFRCGVLFTRAWKLLDDVDDATATRLKSEQMLEVSEMQPDDFVAETTDATNSSGVTTGVSSPGSTTAPEDPAVRLAEIRTAIGQLNKDDAALWTAGGQPKVEAIAAITGWPVTAAERDAAVADGGAQ